MKKFKLGFTLAEVLITLGIIGVVAAIVMPTVMTAHQYSVIGTRVAKMVQQTENSARSYAVMQDDNITGGENGNFAAWFADTFIFVEGDVLKDGTRLRSGGAVEVTGGHNEALHGPVVGSIVFNARPDGLQSARRDKAYTFGVTELGYVFPIAGCTAALVENRYKMTKQFFDNNGCEALANFDAQ